MGRVGGKVVFVVGAGGGIGGAGAAGLGREGAAVVCADIDAAAAEATAAQIRGANGRAAALGLDVRDRAAVDAAVAAAVREFGRLDVLLDCAGVSQTATFLDLDPGEWDRIIAINLTGMFHLGQAAARQMVQQGDGGSIINVTSQLAEVARPDRAAYVASKGGGRSLTHAMAVDLASHGIRHLITPIPTLEGRPCDGGDIAFILFPFVEGISGGRDGLSPAQWKELGATVRAIHDLRPDHELTSILRTEEFVPFTVGLLRDVRASMAAWISGAKASRRRSVSGVSAPPGPPDVARSPVVP